jgi:hypothetical protein
MLGAKLFNGKPFADSNSKSIHRKPYGDNKKFECCHLTSSKNFISGIFSAGGQTKKDLSTPLRQISLIIYGKARKHLLSVC